MCSKKYRLEKGVVGEVIDAPGQRFLILEALRKSLGGGELSEMRCCTSSVYSTPSGMMISVEGFKFRLAAGLAVLKTE